MIDNLTIPIVSPDRLLLSNPGPIQLELLSFKDYGFQQSALPFFPLTCNGLLVIFPSYRRSGLSLLYAVGTDKYPNIGILGMRSSMGYWIKISVGPTYEPIPRSLLQGLQSR